MDLGIRNRRAIVTGGGSGIGYETARVLLEEGVRVMICGRSDATLNMARDALANATGGEIRAIRADMSKEAEIVRLVDAANAMLGGVDILVNNAGTMYSGRFSALTDEALQLQLVRGAKHFRENGAPSGFRCAQSRPRFCSPGGAQRNPGSALPSG
jgi:3-oxoacyl-[acyl-carrier protein] reductase